MTTLSGKAIGAIKVLASIAGFAAINAIVAYLGDAAHVQALIGGNALISGMIATFFGAWEGHIDDTKGVALFGAIKRS